MTNIDGNYKGANDNNIFVKGGELGLNFNNGIQCHACQSKDMTRAHLIVQFAKDQIQNSKKDNNTLLTRLRVNWNFRLFALIVRLNRWTEKEDANLWTTWATQTNYRQQLHII